MKKSILLIILVFSLISEIFGQSPTWEWAKKGDGLIYSNPNSMASVTDSAGNVYVTGNFQSDSITFNNITLHNSNISSEDIYFVKYNPNGKVLWAIKANGIAPDFSKAITIDKEGYIYITGYFGSNSLTFGNITIYNTGLTDIFIAKFDWNGKVIWVKSVGGINYDRTYGITASPDGYIYVTGSVASFNIILGKDTLSPGFFIAKFDTAGNAIWGRSEGAGIGGNSICTDANSNVYITGSFVKDSIILGNYKLINFGSEDIFIVKFTPSGKVLWARRAGGKDVDRSQTIITNKTGQVYIGGWFKSSKITFGGFTLYSHGPNADVFIAKYDSNGNIIWAKGAIVGNHSTELGIATDTSGNSFLTGTFQDINIQFGNYSLTNNSKFYGSLRAEDMFVVKYDSTGDVIWAINPYGVGNERPLCITTDPYQNIYIAGCYAYSDVLFCRNKLDTAGQSYFFIAKLINCKLPKPVISITGNTTICQGDSVILTSSSYFGNLWSDSSQNNTITVKKSGIYSVTVSDSSCCSSKSADVKITALPKPSSPAITLTGDTIFCSGDSVILSSSPAFFYLWSDSSKSRSVTVKKSGNYSVMVFDSFGCMASSRQVKVKVLQSPTAGFNINLNPQNLTGNNFIFTSTSIIPSGNLNYLWDFGDGDTSSQTNPSHSYIKTGRYAVKLVVKSDYGCVDTFIDTAIIRFPNINISLTLPDGCVGVPVYFKNKSTVNPPDSFLNFIWDYGDGNQAIIYDDPQHIYNSAGSYVITFVCLTAYGNKDTLIDTIEIYPSPTIEITAVPDSIMIPGTSVTLNANGTYDNLLWWNNSTGQSVTVQTSGKYWVTASYNSGCISSDTIWIVNGENKEIVIVNVFTPNGDGYNDYFVVKDIKNYQPVKLGIYNRWSDELYKSLDYQNRWDGTYKGKKLPEGTYYYVLETKDGKVYKGAVNIISN